MIPLEVKILIVIYLQNRYFSILFLSWKVLKIYIGNVAWNNTFHLDMETCHVACNNTDLLYKVLSENDGSCAQHHIY